VLLSAVASAVWILNRIHQAYVDVPTLILVVVRTRQSVSSFERIKQLERQTHASALIILKVNRGCNPTRSLKIQLISTLPRGGFAGMPLVREAPWNDELGHKLLLWKEYSALILNLRRHAAAVGVLPMRESLEVSTPASPVLLLLSSTFFNFS
jgi:hypothetical protein